MGSSVSARRAGYVPVVDKPEQTRYPSSGFMPTEVYSVSRVYCAECGTTKGRILRVDCGGSEWNTWCAPCARRLLGDALTLVNECAQSESDSEDARTEHKRKRE